MKVLVLGHSGMLGHEMARELKQEDVAVTTAGRTGADIEFDVSKIDLSDGRLQGFDYLINCIGLTTHNINESDSASVSRAKQLNTVFPKQLARFAESSGAKVIQIATDCVFSGAKGGYLETDSHDARDVYGTTKSVGEIESPAVMQLRCSIIGRETKGKKSLLEWVLGQPQGATVPGFTDRHWNGVTTTGFARVVAGIIQSSGFRATTRHLIPADQMTKFELVSKISEAFGRDDLEVSPRASGVAKDLTLSTIDPEFNAGLWRAAGYQSIPSIKELIAEIAG
jgi:dTDP-4-dehydrorhamnose reductase